MISLRSAGQSENVRDRGREASPALHEGPFAPAKFEGTTGPRATFDDAKIEIGEGPDPPSRDGPLL
jgi:hypothetical protein